MFKIEDCILRLAQASDREDLIDVSRGIWGGHDYLPQILDRWIGEDWFFVCEYHGKVVACLKLTRLPDHVLWFEGLRVHRRYQGKGIAKLMNRELFHFAASLKKQQPELKYEFCTYYKNTESLAITARLGSKLLTAYYNLERRGVVRTQEPEIVQDYGMEIFLHYPQHLPLNWHVVHSKEESLPYIREHATVFKAKRALYLIGSEGERCITLLSDVPEDISVDLPYLQYFFGPRKLIRLTLPSTMRKQLPLLKQHKFYFWDEDGEEALNILLFSLPAL